MLSTSFYKGFKSTDFDEIHRPLLKIYEEWHER